jgi:polyisoprenoid-binding protein YceI
MRANPIPTLLFFGFLTAVAGAATLEVDVAKSRIQVDARATGHQFTGNLEKYTIKAQGTGANEPTSFELTWDFNNLKTGDVKRDAEMVKWLGGGNPKGSFKMTKGWKEASGKTAAMGNLTVNKISKSIAFPYTVKREGEWVTIDGTVTMDYQNFKLPIIRSMAVMTVDPKLVVRFHVVGKVK